MGKRSSLGLTCLFLLLASTVRAQSVEDARRHYLEAEFEEAVADFEAILARPSLDAAMAVEAHAHLMVIRLVLGDREAARVHASYALALDPSVSAPAGAPPEAGELLGEARAEVRGGTQLTIDASTAPERGAPTTFVASLDRAPAGLFAGIRLRCASGDQTAEETGPPPRVELSLRPREEVFCRASASTQGGALLLRIRDSFELTQPHADRARDDEAGRSRAGVWVGVSIGVLAVAAAIVAIVLVVPDDQARLGVPVIE